MKELDFTSVRIDRLTTHFVGNKLRDEKFKLSNEETSVNDTTSEHLIKYFLSSFKPIDFHCFSHPINLEMNEVFLTVQRLFSGDDFIEKSKDLAKLLYDHSSHPKIKGGELNIVEFYGVQSDNEQVVALGIFKSEESVPFIRLNGKSDNYQIDHDYGFDLKGIDKGCLILNEDEENGYNVLLVDKSSKGLGTQYWQDDFLQLKPINDDYHMTQDVMSIAKDFVTNNIPDEFEFGKTDKIELLNRTMNYFKENDSFEKSQFENTVFQDEKVISSFRDFGDNIRQENQIELEDSFEISSQAVKKQTRKFKRILKLDKNFHVYIHGNKELIEKGVENDGRKFYKIYYDQEE